MPPKPSLKKGDVPALNAGAKALRDQASGLHKDVVAMTARGDTKGAAPALQLLVDQKKAFATYLEALSAEADKP